MKDPRLRQDLPVRTLVVGHGSIGSRHARLLEELGCQVALLTAVPR
jgi:pyruvate/2-oxoglutarate dehydrogenase complex dihydrolipoamide dehydrogenase (E3) component